jgi:hypothetical protein
MAQALRQSTNEQLRSDQLGRDQLGNDLIDTDQIGTLRQPALDERWSALSGRFGGQRVVAQPNHTSLCAWCREREARYGFRDEEDPSTDRPRALCFECFRMEIGRRQAVAARLSRGWNAQQVRLPLEETLERLTRQRRRAQIAARHALGG